MHFDINKKSREEVFKIAKQCIENNQWELDIDEEFDKSIKYIQDHGSWAVFAKSKSSESRESVFIIHDETKEISFTVANIKNYSINELLERRLKPFDAFEIARKYIEKYNLKCWIDEDLKKSVVLYESIFAFDNICWVVEAELESRFIDIDKHFFIISDETKEVVEVLNTRGYVIKEEIENNNKSKKKR